MRTSKSLTIAFVLAWGMGGLATEQLHAQPQPPEIPEQRKNDMEVTMATPERRKMLAQVLQNTTPEQRQRIRQMLEKRLPNMMPQQQQEWKQQIQQLFQTPQERREAWVRQVASGSGFTDVELQNTIIAFIQTQEKARAALRKEAFALSESLVNTALTEEQLKAVTASYREAVTKDHKRYMAELVVLNGKIKYSTNPRLELLLNVLGVIGNETSALGGLGAIFPDSGFKSSLMTTTD